MQGLSLSSCLCALQWQWGGVCFTCQSREKGDDPEAAAERWQEGLMESQRGRISCKSHNLITREGDTHQDTLTSHAPHLAVKSWWCPNIFAYIVLKDIWYIWKKVAGSFTYILFTWDFNWIYRISGGRLICTLPHLNAHWSECEFSTLDVNKGLQLMLDTNNSTYNVHTQYSDWFVSRATVIARFQHILGLKGKPVIGEWLLSFRQ